MDWNLWPQYAVIAIFLLSLVIGLEHHDYPKTGYNNSVLDLISVSILVWLLYVGGFWT